MIRANVKPLTHWIIYKGYTVRFGHRSPQEVTGVVTTAQGEVAFRYDPQAMVVMIGDERVQINEYGWEMGRE